MSVLKKISLLMIGLVFCVAGCSRHADPVPTGSVKELSMPAGLHEADKSDYYHVPVPPREPKAHREASVPHHPSVKH